MKSLSRNRIDIIVGLFVVFAIVSVTFIALRSANLTEIATKKDYSLFINFDNVGSLVQRAPVKSSGVRVGQVKKIEYNGLDHVANVEITIEDRYHFPTDSIFSIVSSNLLGGQYVAIEVGGELDALKDKDTLDGNSAIVLEDLISRFLFDNAGDE